MSKVVCGDESFHVFTRRSKLWFWHFVDSSHTLPYVLCVSKLFNNEWLGFVTWNRVIEETENVKAAY